MSRPRKYVKLPDGMNPNRMLTFREASEISGMPLRMLYEWRRQPWRGLRVYKLGRRVFFKASEFIRWINAHLQESL